MCVYGLAASGRWDGSGIYPRVDTAPPRFAVLLLAAVSRASSLKRPTHSVSNDRSNRECRSQSSISVCVYDVCVCVLSVICSVLFCSVLSYPVLSIS